VLRCPPNVLHFIYQRNTLKIGNEQMDVIDHTEQAIETGLNIGLISQADIDAVGNNDWKRHDLFRKILNNQNVVLENLHVGMPATFGIGSDAYAEEVTSWTYFKSGVKAGLVRTVTTNGGVYTIRKDGRLRPDGSDYGSLIVGYARDYRDPSF
jgi:hypothetical protein